MGAFTRKHIKLAQVVNALPPELTYEQFNQLVGDQTEFTKGEMIQIVHEAKEMLKAQAKAIEASPVVATLVEPISPAPEVQEPPKPSYVKLAGDVVCRGLFERSKCQAPLVNKGVNGSGFCETCWYPNIVEDYNVYQGHRDEGYSRNEAASMAGILQEPEKKRVPTYAEKGDRKERSDTFNI